MVYFTQNRPSLLENLADWIFPNCCCLHLKFWNFALCDFFSFCININLFIVLNYYLFWLLSFGPPSVLCLSWEPHSPYIVWPYWVYKAVEDLLVQWVFSAPELPVYSYLCKICPSHHTTLQTNQRSSEASLGVPGACLAFGCGSGFFPGWTLPLKVLKCA